MASVNILNVKVLNNPAFFSEPLRFEITFECLCPLAEDLNWKLVYVGSAESAKYDQVLDSIMVGPVPVGINRFVFETDAPRPELIPQHEIRGVTVLLLICSYVDQEFIRIGYYVDNDYEDEILREGLSDESASESTVPVDAPVDITKLRRNILEDKPRVTRFNIIWDDAKLAQSKANGGAIFEVPEELLAIKDPVNLEPSEDETSDNSSLEDLDSNEVDETDTTFEEEIGETEGEDEVSGHSAEEDLASENNHPKSLNQVVVMDMVE